MSRIADAYRRSGRVPFDDGSDTWDAAARAVGAWIAPEPSSASAAVLRDADRRSQSATAGTDVLPARPDVTRRMRDAAMDARVSDLLLPIVHRILLGNAMAPGVRSVLFSPVSAEHSGSLCVSTAEGLCARQEGPVCVVDANLRAPSLHSRFGVDREPGLSDLLRGEAEIPRCLTRIAGNLWLLPAGSMNDDAPALLAGEHVRRHMVELQRTCEYVLLDAPDISSCGDAMCLGAAVDAVVLVLRANATRREVARIVMQQLTEANIEVLGAILTDRTYPVPDAVYRSL